MLPFDSSCPEGSSLHDAGAPPRPLRVLVVDDHDDSREMTKEVLELVGHSVTMADEGERALELLLGGEFDVAVMDVHLPKLDGFCVAQRVRDAMGDRAPRLVAMSGAKPPAVVAPFDVYLVKPVALEALVEAMGQTRSP